MSAEDRNTRAAVRLTRKEQASSLALSPTATWLEIESELRRREAAAQVGLPVEAAWSEIDELQRKRLCSLLKWPDSSWTELADYFAGMNHGCTYCNDDRPLVPGWRTPDTETSG